MASRKKFRMWTNNVENNDDQEELLMFGYSCKLFRDDEKACYIDDGKHLIPWMGDSSLLIDRYDGRGYLHDLKPFEAGENYEITEEELSMEKMCDEERYLSLSKNLSDEELYHEEELKRLRAALADDGTYNQVQFAYAEESEPKNESATDNGTGYESSFSKDFGKSKFVPPEELEIPEGMEFPSTLKINTIIEKTALFIQRHGTPMEIVIKTKQANNPQFAFLSFDNLLNPYYKHMIQAIKSGKFVPKAPPEESSEEDDSGDEHYLHPSLMSGAQAKQDVFSVPKIAYAKTGDDRYSLLVNQLKDKVYADIAEVQRSSPKPDNVDKVEYTVIADFNIPPPPGLEPVMLPPPESTNLAASGEELAPVVIPPPEVIPVVEKLALYVAKNGEDFEAVVKAKGNSSKFDFLNTSHIYYPYYRQRLRLTQKDLTSKLNGADDNSIDGSKTGVVSFSIKLKEISEKKCYNNNPDHTQDLNSGKFGLKFEGPANCVENVEESADVVRLRAELQEARLAEERIRDRLAAAARERLAKVSKEKQLQMERKRKAAMFLSMLQKGKGESLIGPRLPTTAELESISDCDGEKSSLISTFPSIGSPRAKTPSLPDSENILPFDDSDLEKCATDGSPVSITKEPRKKTVDYSHKKSRHIERSNSRSRSRSRSKRRHRSHSSSSERRQIKRNRSRRHSSSSPENKSKKYSKRKSSRTPPASYMRVRNSSPSRRRSRSKSRSRHGRHSRS